MNKDVSRTSGDQGRLGHAGWSLNMMESESVSHESSKCGQERQGRADRLSQHPIQRTLGAWPVAEVLKKYLSTDETSWLVYREGLASSAWDPTWRRASTPTARIVAGSTGRRRAKAKEEGDTDLH